MTEPIHTSRSPPHRAPPGPLDRRGCRRGFGRRRHRDDRRRGRGAVVAVGIDHERPHRRRHRRRRVRPRAAVPAPDAATATGQSQTAAPTEDAERWQLSSSSACMGTTAHVIVVARDDRRARRATAWAHDGSTTSKRGGVASSPTVRCRVSTPRRARRSWCRATRSVSSSAVEGWRRTRGSFDPTVLDALVARGTTVTSTRSTTPTPARPSRQPAPGCADVTIDRVVGSCRLPPAACTSIPAASARASPPISSPPSVMARDADGVCVNLGGDLRVEGDAPDGHGWIVDLEHPLTGRSMTHVRLRTGAVASTWRTRRVWGPPPARRHHLIDRATGTSAAEWPRGEPPCSRTARVVGGGAGQSRVPRGHGHRQRVARGAPGLRIPRRRRRDRARRRARRAVRSMSERQASRIFGEERAGPSRPAPKVPGAGEMNQHLASVTCRRGTGIVSWGLIVHVDGVQAPPTRRLLGSDARRPWWMLGVHRFLGAARRRVRHRADVLTIVADNYTTFGLADVLVPFASMSKPLPGSRWASSGCTSS